MLHWKRRTHIRGTQHDNKLQHGHTQQDMNSTDITCVHTGHLWYSHAFTLFVCGMQRIHKHKIVGCALSESLETPTGPPLLSSRVICGHLPFMATNGSPSFPTLHTGEGIATSRRPWTKPTPSHSSHYWMVLKGPIRENDTPSLLQVLVSGGLKGGLEFCRMYPFLIPSLALRSMEPGGGGGLAQGLGGWLC